MKDRLLARLKQSRDGDAPTREELLAFIAESEGPVTRREIARAFNVKGEARAELRALLKELAEEGALDASGRRRFGKAEALPPIAPIDVMSVDEDGDLLCMPVSWNGGGDPPMIRLDRRRAEKQKPPPGVGDRLLARLKAEGDRGYSADIIKPIGRGAHRFLAVFRKKRRGGAAEPVERRARNTFEIDENDAAGAKDGDLVWVEAKNERGYGPKKGRVRKIEGHVDDRNAFSAIALANHGIPVEFPTDVIAEAEAAALPTLRNRDDLRDIPLLTIDPADARDHDDAVWSQALDDGGFTVIVAIADVSHFVRIGSAIDREARRRGNSTYLPDRVVPMLPERLSNDLCSLKEGVERPCLAVELTLNANGAKIKHRFIRGVMRSAAKLAYEDAQAIIDGGEAPKEISATVHALHAAFQARMKERKKRAPLDLDLPERRVVLGEDGRVKNVVKRERFDAHRLIEEFMILANVAAAETLEREKTPLIYRVHDAPDSEKLDSVRDYLDSLGYSLIKGAVRPSHFNQLLSIAASRDEQEMISDVILRSQKQAVYATENAGHFGLNLGRYAHFTSPIRRYADLTVHRSLIKACKLAGADKKTDSEENLSEIAQSISDFERRSMAAEREATDRYLSDFLSSRLGAEFDGRIRGVTRFGLFIALDETGADGFAPARTLGAEYFRFVEEQHALIGDTTGGVYRLGQQVRVRLAEATPLTGGLRFEMLSDPLPGNRSTRKRTKRASQKNTKKSSAKRNPKKPSRARKKR